MLTPWMRRGAAGDVRLVVVMHLSIRERAAQLPRRRVIAKFHYTDPTGPARTGTDFLAAKLRWVRAGLRQSPCGSVPVRAGPVGPV